MTRIEELERVRSRLDEARAAIGAAIKTAVLSRDRRAAYERIELQLLDQWIDVDDELQRRTSQVLPPSDSGCGGVNDG